MEISGNGLLQFDQESSSLIGNQIYHRSNMFLPYQPNSCYESDYECICIMINDKTCSVPLNILSSVYCHIKYIIRFYVCQNAVKDSYSIKLSLKCLCMVDLDFCII